MTRPTAVALGFLFVCCCLEAATSSPLSVRSLCKSTCSQCKAVGSLTDGVCVCTVSDVQLKRNMPCLSEAEQKAAKSGLKLVLTTPFYTNLKRSRRCTLGLRERMRARAHIKAAPVVKDPEDIIKEAQEDLGLLAD